MLIYRETSRCSRVPPGGDAAAPTLHLTPYTLHLKPYTPHPAPCLFHQTPYTLHPTPYTLHFEPHTLHPSPLTTHPYTLTPKPQTLNPTPQIPKQVGAVRALLLLCRSLRLSHWYHKRLEHSTLIQLSLSLSGLNDSFHICLSVACALFLCINLFLCFIKGLTISKRGLSLSIKIRRLDSDDSNDVNFNVNLKPSTQNPES